MPGGTPSTKLPPPSESVIESVFWLVGFLTSSSTTRLYRGRAPRLTSDNLKSCHTRDRAGRPWLLSQPEGPRRGSDPGPPGQESRALTTELTPPPPPHTHHLSARRWCLLDKSQGRKRRQASAAQVPPDQIRLIPNRTRQSSVSLLQKWITSTNPFERHPKEWRHLGVSRSFFMGEIK